MASSMGMKFTRAPALVRLDRIRKALEEKGPATTKQMAALVFISDTFCRTYMQHLHLALGEIHVCGWDQPATGKTAPIFKLGPGRDVPQPPTRTEAERRKQRRKKLVADIDALDLHRARQNAWHHRRKAKKPDPAAAWLFNPIPVETHQPNEGTV